MYYFIQHSMNIKNVGKFFQSETIAWNYGNIDNPHLLNNIYFKKVDFEPIVPIPILHKKAKITDLISCVNAGGSIHLIMSEKLKYIILKYRNDGLQFFKTSVIQGNIEYDDYFAMNIWETNNEVIDFHKSIMYYKKYNPNKIEDIMEINFNSVNEFDDFLKNKNMFDEISFKKIYIKTDNIFDFFMIKFPVELIVSEKLKKEIEDAGCTGIEFQPIELSYNEWSAPGGEREKVYGKA